MNVSDKKRGRHTDIAFAKDTLQKEYFAISDGIGQMLRSNTDILVGSMTLLAAIAGVAISYKVYVVLVLLPFLVSCFSLFGMRRLAEMLAMGGYRCAIEEVLWEFTGGQTVMWETAIRGPLVGRFAKLVGGGLYVLYGVGFIASAVTSVVVIGKVQDTAWAYVLLGGGLLLASVLLGYQAAAIPTTYGRAYRAANGALNASWRSATAGGE